MFFLPIFMSSVLLDLVRRDPDVLLLITLWWWAACRSDSRDWKFIQSCWVFKRLVFISWPLVMGQHMYETKYDNIYETRYVNFYWIIVGYYLDLRKEQVIYLFITCDVIDASWHVFLFCIVLFTSCYFLFFYHSYRVMHIQLMHI